MNLADPELAIPQEGYPALADWIAADPDNETFIFRKFDRLAARSLLALQAKLFALEVELDELEREMCGNKDISQRESTRRWETLVMHAADPNRPEARYLELQEKIRIRLKEYRACFWKTFDRHGFADTPKMKHCCFREISLR